MYVCAEEWGPSPLMPNWPAIKALLLLSPVANSDPSRADTGVASLIYKYLDLVLIKISVCFSAAPKINQFSAKKI